MGALWPAGERQASVEVGWGLWSRGGRVLFDYCLLLAEFFNTLSYQLTFTKRTQSPGVRPLDASYPALYRLVMAQQALRDRLLERLIAPAA